MVDPRILFVDDEPNLLDGIRRTLFEKYDFLTASSGAEALDLIRREGPFAVVVSDMRMPAMNGAELLSRIRVRSPDTVRVLLTGHSDIDAAIDAINDGQVFRFLTKPCPSQRLISTLEDSLAHYRLITSERELLEKTLSGAVNVLIDVLGLAAPSVLAQANQLRACVSHVVRTAQLRDPWRFELASLLLHLGHVAIPQEILRKTEVGEQLTEQEKATLNDQYEVTYNLLRNIPRINDVAEIIRAQSQTFPANSFRDRDMQLGASSLRLCMLAIDQVKRGMSIEEAAKDLAQSDDFHPTLVRALTEFSLTARTQSSKKISIAQLLPGMILEADILTPKGIVVVPQGREVTTALIARLQSFARGHGIVEPIAVTVFDAN